MIGRFVALLVVASGLVLHRHPTPVTSPTHLLADVASTMLGLTLAWVAAGVVVGHAVRLPGILGQVAAVCWRALVPKAFRWSFAVAIGLAGLVTPTAAAADGALHPDVPALGRPDPAVPACAPAHPSARPQADQAAPPQADQAALRQRSRPATVTVAPGDSLWRIAERQLGADASAAEIAELWPRWYRANREIIGSDPDLLHIGTVLTEPGDQDPPR